MLSIEEVNAKIKDGLCRETIEKLCDAKLMDEYMECKSVKNEIKRLSNILGKYIDDDTRQKIIGEYLPQLIPAGTKGAIRGNKFNKIVKEHIESDYYPFGQKGSWGIRESANLGNMFVNIPVGFGHRCMLPLNNFSDTWVTHFGTDYHGDKNSPHAKIKIEDLFR